MRSSTVTTARAALTTMGLCASMCVSCSAAPPCNNYWDKEGGRIILAYADQVVQLGERESKDRVLCRFSPLGSSVSRPIRVAEDGRVVSTGPFGSVPCAPPEDSPSQSEYRVENRPSRWEVPSPSGAMLAIVEHCRSPERFSSLVCDLEVIESASGRELSVFSAEMYFDVPVWLDDFRLVFKNASRENVVATVDGSTTATLGRPEWSIVARIGNRSRVLALGMGEVRELDLDSGASRLVTTFQGSVSWAGVVSPEGRFAVVSVGRYSEERHDVILVNVESGESCLLRKGERVHGGVWLRGSGAK